MRYLKYCLNKFRSCIDAKLSNCVRFQRLVLRIWIGMVFHWRSYIYIKGFNCINKFAIGSKRA